MKRYCDWEPIKSPIWQNTILGCVVGVMVGINLRAIILSGGEATWAWVMFFMIGPLFGFFSGLERKRWEKQREEERRKANP